MAQSRELLILLDSTFHLVILVSHLLDLIHRLLTKVHVRLRQVVLQGRKSLDRSVRLVSDFVLVFNYCLDFVSHIYLLVKVHLNNNSLIEIKFQIFEEHLNLSQ